jgi:CPA1 family monovalent cation:H+ antiporter
MMIHNPDTHVLIELLLPFLSYVAAEFFGFSGILAAVTAGTLQAFDFKKTGLREAEIGNAEKTVWDTVSFVLNAVVFLMLGMQMPAAFLHVWKNEAYNNGFVIAVTVLTTLVMYAVRFLSLSFFPKDVVGRGFGERIRNTLILTLAGVKGVVAIAAAVSLPTFFTRKPLLMFISAGSITLTLLLALFLLPFVTTKSPEEKDRDNRAQIALLRDVVRRLRAKDSERFDAVIVSCRKRIREIEYASGERDEHRRMKSLRVYAAAVEKSILSERLDRKEISREMYKDYMEMLSVTRRAEVAGMLSHTFASISRRITRFARSGKALSAGITLNEYRLKLRDMFRDLTDLIVKSLDDVRDRYPEKLIDLFVEDRVHFMGHLIDDAYAGTSRTRQHGEYVDELLTGYDTERETIRDFLDAGKLTVSQAAALRLNVNKLESHILDDQMDVILKLTSSVGQREACEPE